MCVCLRGLNLGVLSLSLSTFSLPVVTLQSVAVLRSLLSFLFLLWNCPLPLLCVSSHSLFFLSHFGSPSIAGLPFLFSFFSFFSPFPVMPLNRPHPPLYLSLLSLLSPVPLCSFLLFLLSYFFSSDMPFSFLSISFYFFSLSFPLLYLSLSFLQPPLNASFSSLSSFFPSLFFFSLFHFPIPVNRLLIPFFPFLSRHPFQHHHHHHHL